MVFAYLSRQLAIRRATHGLSEAIRARDIPAMRQFLALGASVDKVKCQFDEPMQHFRMSYEILGALPLAIEVGLPQEGFSLLLEHGAAIPSGRLEDHFANFGPQAQPIIEMIERVGHQHLSLQENTVPATARRPCSRL